MTEQTEEQKQTSLMEKEHTIKHTDNPNKIFYEAENEILNDERKSTTDKDIERRRENNN